MTTRGLMRTAIFAPFMCLACSGSELPPSSPSAGTGGTTVAGAAGGLPVAGTLSSGGASGGAPASAGAAGTAPTTGGAAPTGGSGGSGGRSGAPGQAGTPSTTGGMAGMNMGSAGRPGSGGASGGAGMSSGGAGGSGQAGAAAGGKAPAEPSAGCGKANPQTGSSGSPLMVSNHQYYVKLPSAYDAQKPYPVIFMFNPTGNPINWAEQNAGFESNGAKDAAIRVYPHPANSSSGWGANDVSFFQPLYDQITSNFCADKARMFAAGESSGGDFSSILGCEHADKLRAIGPCATKNVSQYPLDAGTRKCTGQVTAVVIHGKMDSVVGTENGPKTRDFYRTLNNCGTNTMPVQGFTDTLSNCLQYQGCDAGYDVYFCQHTDPNYSNTNHGWPAFAPKMLWQLFSSF